MNKIREILARTIRARSLPVRCCQTVLVAVLALAACGAGAQPANDNFANAATLIGSTGITSGNNAQATLEPCEATAVNTPSDIGDPLTNSVWFKWVCPTNGTMELDTFGSAFEAILSVWTSPNPNPTLCGNNLTLLAADDDGQLSFSEVKFPVTAGVTYYVSVASWNDFTTPFDNAGQYELNWNASYPTVPTGSFGFTLSQYIVSQTDSASPVSDDKNTVNPSVLGARLTVTRPAPAYGSVLVDYAVADGLYTNIFRTNYFGTNILTEYISTNGSITYSNSYSTNIISLNAFQYGEYGYQYNVVTNAYTNTAVQALTVAYAATNATGPAPLTPVPANLPLLANYQTAGASFANGFTITTVTNVFGDLLSGLPTNGTLFLNGSTLATNASTYANYETFFTNTFVTNVFGTNFSQSYLAAGFSGLFYSTNFYYTNLVVGLAFATNSVYTNGASAPVFVLTTGTNWLGATAVASMTETILNASNYLTSIGALQALLPNPTNWPAPVGTTFLGGSATFDSGGNESIVSTNSYSYQLISTQIVVSASQEGIFTNSGTLSFANLQMSADIIVPMIAVINPDAPSLPGVSGTAQLTLSNPRLNPLEDTNLLIAPTLGTNYMAKVEALSPTFTYGPGVFNFERSTFRVARNQGSAIISVTRTGGNPGDAVSVDYVIDPDYPDYGSISPKNDFNAVGIRKLYDPANTFQLQAGSDYATENSDFTPVTGTLNWSPGDYHPKPITIPIQNNGLVEFNEDMLIQLQNAEPQPSASDIGMVVGQVNQATLTILFDGDNITLGGQPPGQQPAGAVDRSWNKDHATDSTPPLQLYPGTTPGNGGHGLCRGGTTRWQGGYCRHLCLV